MGLNVGGIYVLCDDQRRVAEAIKRFWLAIGAKPLAQGIDPLTLGPLDVAKTGKLGYAVFPAAPDAEGRTWVAVYDSERYHGSSELAAALADALDTEVLDYAFSGTVDEAALGVLRGPTVKKSKLRRSSDWGEIETLIGSLPYAMVYFNKLREADGGMDDVEVFGFEDMPFREGSYRGPSPDERAATQRLEELGAAVARGDVATARALYDAHPDERYTMLGTITEPFDWGWDAQLAFEEKVSASRAVLFAMADEILAAPDRRWHVERLAAGAYLAGERALFERVATVMKARVGALEPIAVLLLRNGRIAEGVELLRRICAQPTAPDSAFNSLAFGLIGLETLPDDATTLLEACETRGRAHPYILHNTACVWVRLKQHARAIAAVREAVRAGYPKVADMRVDTDLAPLFDDPDFIAAFER